MSENNAKGDKDSFDIDMGKVNLECSKLDNCEKIQIFVLTSTLLNPYSLVMFSALAQLLKKIKKQYPNLNFENKLYINFLVIHEIAKYAKIGVYFNPLKEHYKYFMLPEKNEDKDIKNYLSSIIELRFNEFMTLTNKIMLNMVDEESGEKMLMKATALNFRYDDIYCRGDKIGEDYDADIKNFMNSYEANGSSREQISEIIREIFFEKVAEREELIKCLLKIYCYELEQSSSQSREDAIFFIADRVFKKLIENSSGFEGVNTHLICPTNDPESKKLDLYLNPLSKYIIAGSELNVEYFSSVLQKLHCELFDTLSDQRYKDMIIEYQRYKSIKDAPADLWADEIKRHKEAQRLLSNSITKGFTTVQEEDLLAQLTYIT